ncbi:MAG: hypothetical protein U0169_04625 [Polyangiaceae bacterium]
MRFRTLAWGVLLIGCSSNGTVPAETSDAAAAAADAATDAGASANDLISGLRGTRYCEVLALTSDLDTGTVHVDVYNTQGLGDCPDEAWRALDARTIATQLGVTQAILNGPRYWMIDAFVNGELVDPATTTFGTVPMRRVATISVPTSQLLAISAPYTLRRIQRKTTVRFVAGAAVHELVDPEGRVFVMQSYSTQTRPQTEGELPTLAERLGLPAGWRFQVRVPSEDLVVTAEDGVANVVQDDFANTYQMRP